MKNHTKDFSTDQKVEVGSLMFNTPFSTSSKNSNIPFGCLFRGGLINIFQNAHISNLVNI